MGGLYEKQRKLLTSLAVISLIYFAYSYYQENYYQNTDRKELFVSTCIDVLSLDAESCKDFMNKYAVFMGR